MYVQMYVYVPHKFNRPYIYRSVIRSVHIPHWLKRPYLVYHKVRACTTQAWSDIRYVHVPLRLTDLITDQPRNGLL